MINRWIDRAQDRVRDWVRGRVRDWSAFKLVFFGTAVGIVVSEAIVGGIALLLGEGVPSIAIAGGFLVPVALGLPLMAIVARFGARLRTAEDALRGTEAALKAERASLSRRVAERTAALSAANVELSRAIRAKDEFLAAMSRDLRTPLHAVLGLSQALQEGVYGPLNQRQLQSLHTIEKSGHHLLVLINGILDVATIGAGKLELQIAPISVKAICEASLAMVEPAARKKRLNIVSDCDGAVATVQADPLRLKQILVHLLGNGIKFAAEGGTVGLEVVGDVEQEVARFTVWDTGVGIPEEDMGRLFASSVQWDPALWHRDGGMGLGLALVRQLTEMHGGGVGVESEVGKGSRFTVSLPWRSEEEGRRPEVESAEAAEPEAEPTVEGCQPAAVVLVAEDNDANLGTVWDYLRARGYEVVVARNGVEAIARAREARPDVILMDIQMPVMDGLEATRCIRADANLGRIPIVALTALAMPGDRERCLEAGIDEYLSKPVSLKWLAQAIETQLGRSRMAEWHG